MVRAGEDVGETHAQMQPAGMWITLDFWESDLVTYIKIKNMHLFNIVMSFLEFILQGSRKKTLTNSSTQGYGYKKFFITFFVVGFPTTPVL